MGEAPGSIGDQMAEASRETIKESLSPLVERLRKDSMEGSAMADAADMLAEVLEIAEAGCGIDGAGHKQFALAQIVRAITGDRYDDWVKAYCDGDDGPDTYGWDEGIAP